MFARLAVAAAGVWLAQRWCSNKSLGRHSVRKQRLKDQEGRWEGEGGATPSGPQLAIPTEAHRASTPTG